MIFCNILNVFTASFDQFNASFLHKTINLLKKYALCLDIIRQFASRVPRKAFFKLIILILNNYNKNNNKLITYFSYSQIWQHIIIIIKKKH